jgi:hypothetical protein
MRDHAMGDIHVKFVRGIALAGPGGKNEVPRAVITRGEGWRTAMGASMRLYRRDRTGNAYC